MYLAENSIVKASKTYSSSKISKFGNLLFHLFSCNSVYESISWVRVAILQEYPWILWYPKPHFQRQQSHRVPHSQRYSDVYLRLSPSEGLHIKDPSFGNLNPVGINKAYVSIENASFGNQNCSGIFWTMAKITWHIHIVPG